MSDGPLFSMVSGIPNLITADMIKEGAAVIDVGINRVQDPVTGKSRLVGDVDFDGKGARAGVCLRGGGSVLALGSNGGLSVLRCEAEGRLHHPCTWGSGTHDRRHADEEHHQSSEERAAVSPGEDPHGRRVLTGVISSQRQRHIPLHPPTPPPPPSFFVAHGLRDDALSH